MAQAVVIHGAFEDTPRTVAFVEVGERTGETIELNAEAWRKSVEIAIWTLGYGSYRVNDNTQGALWYYAHNIVYPTWADAKTTTAIIGGHTFQK